MALLGREFIAVPDDRKGQIVFKWPDITIRRFTRAIVNADEMALFVNTGQVVQTMGPGRHQIDANELPGLGAVIDSITGGNAYRAELYFVGKIGRASCRERVLSYAVAVVFDILNVFFFCQLVI